jgi:integrase
MRLNEQSIRGVALPAAGYVLILDGEFPGFGLRVTANGARSFVLTYTVAGRQRRLTIGSWPAWTATAARERAKELRRQVDRGEDPLGIKEERRDAATFGEIAAEYLEKHAARKKKDGGRRDREILDREVLPVWRYRKAEDIKKRDVKELVERKAAAAPIAGNRLLSCVRKVFNWAAEEELIGSTPCYKMKAPAEEVERERELKPDEIAKMWGMITEHLDDQIARILKLTLCTAQRPGEVCAMEWSELDLDGGWWEIPSTKAKNKVTHRVPLTQLALEQLPPRGSSRWLFPGRRGGDKPILEGSLAHALRREREQIGVDFNPHDLRRTATTQMGKAEVPQEILDKVLNHKKPKRDTTGRVYNKYEYSREKAEALQKWERELKRILGVSERAKVVQMA